jgi:transposase
MSRQAIAINLTAEDLVTLKAWSRSNTLEHRVVQRALIILAAAEGAANRDIGVRYNVKASTVSTWRKRFAERGLNGLDDAPRSGKPAVYDRETEKRILAKLDEPPPSGYATWNGPRVARALGDVSDDQVWRVLRKHKISLERRRSWCISTDPEFVPKAADIVGLYLNPPEGAVVICVDEKPNIQALERAQGWLKLPDGKALTGYNHEYKRHGTSNLFTALTVATGQVHAKHYARKRRMEFLDFMNSVVAGHPEGTELHVILDNYSTHKPKDDRWLKRHSNVHFHFTPTHASWLNQVEVWFSILWSGALRGASFTSPQDLRRAIDRFVTAWSEIAHPFNWTKEVVHPVKPKRKYSDLCK